MEVGQRNLEAGGRKPVIIIIIIIIIVIYTLSEARISSIKKFSRSARGERRVKYSIGAVILHWLSSRLRSTWLASALYVLCTDPSFCAACRVGRSSSVVRAPRGGRDE